MENTDIVSLCLLLSGLCIGLPWLIGVLISFCCKPRYATVFNVALVFTALLQCLSTPMLVIRLTGGTWSWLEHCGKLVFLWHASRHLGMFLHLLVVLEFTAGNPRYGSKLQSVYVSLPIVLTLVVVCMLFSDSTAYAYIIPRVHGGYSSSIGLAAVASGLALVMCATAGLSWCTRRSPIQKREVLLIVMAVFTFCTYAPIFVMLCMMQSGISVSGYLRFYVPLVCLSNLRLVTDALLFWLVTRKSTTRLVVL